MKVGIFYSSISNPAKFPNKTMLMDNFATGVRQHSDEVIEYRQQGPIQQDLDVGFVLGYTLEQNHRRKIIDSLVAQKARPVFVDSNILHYARKEHEWHRYSLDTVYPDSGTYFFSDTVEPKWATYSKWHGVDAKPWRSTGDHILLLCQRPHGWNMFGNSQDTWLDETIGRLKRHTARPLRVRMHPGDGTREQQITRLKQRYGSSVEISHAENIREDLIDCWAAVGYNSTPNVVAAIEGIPVYVHDPVHSWAAGTAFTSLDEIENPTMPDRTEWLERIANIHWSNQEVVGGKLWAAIRNYILTARQ
jgi:hypothetical protein